MPWVILSCILTIPAFATNIGLLIVATGKYFSYAEQLIASAEKYFLKNHHVTYFIFTDAPISLQKSNCVILYQKRLGWPFDTMMRYHVYAKHESLYKNLDYLFASDADMLFVNEVGDEILGERVATLHPGFLYQRGSYESNPDSTAFVEEGEYYFAGGFYGGTKEEVLNIAKTNAANIDQDLQQDYIAVWHDESHWNRYCIDHPPTKILSPSYCYPEHIEEKGWFDPAEYPPKLIALDKYHEDLRE